MEIVKEYDRLVSVKCDICGDITKNDWKESCYDAFDYSFWAKTGSNYPEGGSGEEVSIDICPKCIIGKLIPWVKSFGGEPTIKEWDW